MRHVIRETITLIRIERWFVREEQASQAALPFVSEQVVEELVLNSSEVAEVHELFQRILASQRRSDSHDYVREHTNE
jgi:hypothetical protein